MNDLERAALAKIIEDAPTVAIGTFEYTIQDGQLAQRRVGPSREEVNRLFDSADFKLGWQMCAEHIIPYLEMVMTSSQADLKKYAGRHLKALQNAKKGRR